ncbi:MAG: patatin-like phospholipase family protein [Desulfobacterales bacterium]
MRTEFSRKKIGVALGGGAALGAAHIGILNALEDLDIEIQCIAGTSVGAVVSIFYAFGVPLDEIKHLALRLKWSDTLRFNLSKMGLLSNERLGRMVQGRLGNCCLQDAPLPLAIVATDIEHAEKVVITEGDIKSAIMASTCVPGVFEPVERNGRVLVDGGLLENVPLSPLCDMGAEFRIGVDLIAKHGNYSRPHHMIDVIINAIEMAIKYSTRIQTQAADLLICPDLSDFMITNTRRTDQLIQRGYEAARLAFTG